METDKPTSSIGADVLNGLQETLDMLKGKAVEGEVTFAYQGHLVNVRALREGLQMSREEFADAFYFKLGTLRNWEQGIRFPPTHVLAYLQVIASQPETVLNVLKPVASPLAAKQATTDREEPSRDSRQVD